MCTRRSPHLACELPQQVMSIRLMDVRCTASTAYFTQNKAFKGEPVLTASYQGVPYQFTSKEDQAAFEADPAKHVPQYGGFCALATSIGIKADIDPHAFAINDGKLYVNYSDKALQVY